MQAVSGNSPWHSILPAHILAAAGFRSFKSPEDKVLIREASCKSHAGSPCRASGKYQSRLVQNLLGRRLCMPSSAAGRLTQQEQGPPACYNSSGKPLLVLKPMHGMRPCAASSLTLLACHLLTYGQYNAGGHVSDGHVLWPGCCQIPEGEPVSAAVDGEDGRSWHLPLPPLHATSLPEPYSPGQPHARVRLCPSSRGFI